MERERTLVFGPMPAGATPATHIAAGAWCFVGREALFPNWDGSRGGAQGIFPLPPDPYADAGSMAEAAAAANAEVLRLCRMIASRRPGRRSERFHLAALGPPLLLATHMLAERRQRLLDLTALYGTRNLRVDILPEGDFSFRDSLDFMVRGVQNPVFNHYLYSRMLEHLAPPAWKLHCLSPAPALPRADGAARQPLPARLRASLYRVLLRLPFPPLKGFGLGGALLLSAAVLLNTRRRRDASPDFSLYCAPATERPRSPQMITDDSGQSPNASLPSPLPRFPDDDLIMRCLPHALVRETVRLPSRSPVRPQRNDTNRPSAGSRLRGISPAFSQDDVYRLYTARLADRGDRLFGVQHGANYGNLLSIGGLPFESSLHVFFTWGWSAHPGHAVNARPMPHPVLQSLAGAHKEQRPALILVGTEMSALSYRLKSRPQSGALPAYRAAKIRFLDTVRAGLAPEAAVLYRPYFRAAGALDDGEHVFRLLPDIKPCTGDLTAHMLACRLLVLDHYGTTLHCALAADTPTLAFWKRADWGMDDQSSAALDILARAGILHETPEAAAAQALAVWDDIERWWNGRAVQNARHTWLNRYAWITVPERGDASGKLRASTPPGTVSSLGPSRCATANPADGDAAAEGAERTSSGRAERRKLLRYWFNVLTKV
jgi:hypothetical protein